MDPAEAIKSKPDLRLRENGWLKDVGAPWLYQRRGGLLLALRPRMILGDDTGLGKTIQAIVALSYLKAKRPGLRAVVLTETAALEQWAGEFRKWAPRFDARVIAADSHVGKKDRTFAGFDGDVVVTGYGMLRKYPDSIRAGLGKDYAVVFDEPPFRNDSTMTFEVAKELARGARYCWGMTATLIEGYLEEAVGLFGVIVPGLIRSKAWFLENFAEVQPVYEGKPWPVRIVRYRNLQKFKEHIAPYFYARRSSHPEVMQALPEVVRKEVPITMGRAQSEAVMEAMDGILNLPSGATQLDQLTALLRCQQLVDEPAVLGRGDLRSAKAEALVELLKGSLRGQHVLVFTKLSKVARALHDRLAEAGVGSLLLTGDCTKRDRELAIDLFQSKGVLKVLVLTMAGGRAINLQRGGHLVLYDTPWTHGQEKQLVGRIRRTGSEHSHVVVWRFLACLDRRASGGAWATIDHHCRRHVNRSRKLFEAVVGDSGQDQVEMEKGAARAIVDSIRDEVGLDGDE